MKCRQCKSIEFLPSHRSREERLLSHFVPLRPYRCSGCNDRRWGLTDPIFNLSRLLFLLAISILGLFFLNFFITRVTAVRIQPGETRQAVPTPAQQRARTAAKEMAPEQNQGVEGTTGEVRTGIAADRVETRGVAEVGTVRADRLTSVSEPGFGAAAPSSHAEARQPEPEPPKNQPRVEKEPTEAETTALPATETSSPPLLFSIKTYRKGRAAGAYLLFSGMRPQVKKQYLEAEPRWVIDLLGLGRTEPDLPQEIIMETDIFHRIRFGDHPDKGYFRIVFDLKRGNWPEPQLQWQKDRLLVVIDPD